MTNAEAVMRQFLIFSFACLAALLSGAAAAEPRIAVVIGNADYEVSSWRLDNPGNDARLMAGALRSLGFDVDLVIDADRGGDGSSHPPVWRRLNAAGENAVSFVYFSGHGVQSQGFNYLLPVDANARTEQDVWDQAPRLNQFLDHMAFVGNKVNILVLDACRDNPLRSEYKNLARGGLGDIPRTPNALIAYAAAPGQTATDGAGRNSPYTRALAAALKTRASQRITSLFEDVGAEVFAATQQSQLPEFRAALEKTPGWRLTAEVPLPPSQPNRLPTAQTTQNRCEARRSGSQRRQHRMTARTRELERARLLL